MVAGLPAPVVPLVKQVTLLQDDILEESDRRHCIRQQWKTIWLIYIATCANASAIRPAVISFLRIFLIKIFSYIQK